MLIKKQQTSKNKQKNEKLTCILPKTRNKASFTLKSCQYCQKFNVKHGRFNKNATYVLPKSANSGKNKEWRYNLLDNLPYFSRSFTRV